MDQKQNRHGKDCPPDETISKIRNILACHSFNTQYLENTDSFAGCFSARLILTDVPGGLISSNGKGAGRKYCEASAYAELLERLENRMFLSLPSWEYRPDDNTAKELYHVRKDDSPSCIAALRNRIASTVSDSSVWLSPEILTDNILEMLADRPEDHAYETEPYYRVQDKTLVKLPTTLIQRFTASNGMAAGNTHEEAVVQAMSEIFERFAAVNLLRCQYRPPVIPNRYCDRWPQISGIIRNIEETGRYRVILRDCSMGKKIPVVCGAVVDRTTGHFGVKFGAHPDMQIALERIFTEGLQCCTLEDFASGCYPVQSIGELSQTNTFNQIKVGRGGFPASVLLPDEDYPFKPWDEAAPDNLTMAKELLQLALSMGSDVYISDRSFLGFPAVFIYASVLSEVIPVSFRELKIQLFEKKCAAYFRDLRNLSDQEVKDLMVYADLKRGAIAENTVSILSGRPADPASFRAPENAFFLSALCLVRLHRTEEAVTAFEKLADAILSVDPDAAAFARGAGTFLSAELSGKGLQEIRKLLSACCPEDVADNIFDLFRDKQNILDRCYPLCRGRDCGSCGNSACRYPALCRLNSKLSEAERNNPSDSSIFKELLK